MVCIVANKIPKTPKNFRKISFCYLFEESTNNTDFLGQDRDVEKHHENTTEQAILSNHSIALLQVACVIRYSETAQSKGGCLQCFPAEASFGTKPLAYMKDFYGKKFFTSSHALLPFSLEHIEPMDPSSRN